MFHCLGSTYIRQSTVAPSKKSIMGEAILVGCLMHGEPMVLTNLNISAIARTETSASMDDFPTLKYAFPSIGSQCQIFSLHERAIWKKSSLQNPIKERVCIVHET